jgi:hypothetical protein
MTNQILLFTVAFSAKRQSVPLSMFKVDVPFLADGSRQAMQYAVKYAKMLAGESQITSFELSYLVIRRPIFKGGGKTVLSCKHKSSIALWKEMDIEELAAAAEAGDDVEIEPQETFDSYAERVIKSLPNVKRKTTASGVAAAQAVLNEIELDGTLTSELLMKMAAAVDRETMLPEILSGMEKLMEWAGKNGAPAALMSNLSNLMAYNSVPRALRVKAVADSKKNGEEVPAAVTVGDNDE